LGWNFSHISLGWKCERGMFQILNS